MAGANLTTLQAAVEDNLKRSDKTGEVVQAINDAILHVAQTAKPHEIQDLQNQTTTAGTDTYALDTDALSIELVVITNVGEASAEQPVIVQRGNLRSWMLRNRDSNARGVPTQWFRRNNNIELYDSIPDDNDSNDYLVEIAYVKRPALLTAASPSTAMDLNEEWDRAVEYMATAIMFRKLQDEREQVYLAAYASELQIKEDPKSMENKADDDAHADFI
jgi:hypothetical protein